MTDDATVDSEGQGPDDADEEQGETSPEVPADLLELHQVLEYQEFTKPGAQL